MAESLAIAHRDEPTAREMALADYAVMDTPRDDAFDELAALAAQLCGTRNALVTFVDGNRQFFKAGQWWPGPSSCTLDVGFCPRVVLGEAPLVVPDVRELSDGPGNPGMGPCVRFYAGVPLFAPGDVVIGALCVLDPAPRPDGLSEAQLSALQTVARQVVTQLEHRRDAALRDTLLARQAKVIRLQETLIRVQNAIARCDGNLTGILQAVLDGAMESVAHADGGVCEMVSTDRVGVRAVAGRLEAFVEDAAPALGKLAEECRRTATGLLVRDVAADPRSERKRAAAMGLRSCVIAPVERAGKSVGLLKLMSGTADAFTDEDLQTARVFGALATSAIAESEAVRATRAKEEGHRREQRAAQEALAVKTDLLQTVMDNVGQGIIQMDADGVVTFANPGACSMFGWASEEIVGRNLHDTLHHSHPDGTRFERCDCRLVASLADGRTLLDAEETFFHRDGTAIHVLVTNVPVLADGVLLSGVVTIVDVTARVYQKRRQSGLVEVGDRLRDIRVRTEAIEAASEVACRTLGIDRAGYGSFDVRAGTVTIEGDWCGVGLARLSGTYPIDMHGTHLRDVLRGEDVVVGDAALDLRTAPESERLDGIQCRAFVNLPLMEQGRFAGQFYAADATARRWSVEDLSFLRSVADRTRAAIARIEAEERQDLLNHEIGHRMKNLLAVVQSIAMQATRDASDVETVRESLNNRLGALARAHDILLGGSIDRAGIGTVLRGGVGVMDGGRFTFAGPDIEVGAAAALALALTLHELSTNASKYGALSRDGGSVSVTWEECGDEGDARDLRITWREQGGPPVAVPSRKGFGTRLIERGLTGRVGGTVGVEYAPSGVVCVMQAPVEALSR